METLVLLKICFPLLSPDYRDEPKRQRKEPRFLKGFDVTIATGAEENNRIIDEKTYWKTTAFFPILDTVIFNIKRQFSEESFQMATSIDRLLKMDFEGSHFIIDHYKENNVYTAAEYEKLA
ncbi:hypothetical protein ACI65C_009055 [Semiaphis heraclei]